MKTISKHLNNISKNGELIKEEVTINPNDSINGAILIINLDSKKQIFGFTNDKLLIIALKSKKEVRQDLNSDI